MIRYQTLTDGGMKRARGGGKDAGQFDRPPRKKFKTRCQEFCIPSFFFYLAVVLVA